MKRLVTISLLFISMNMFAQRCVPNTNSLNFGGTTASPNISNSASINSQTNLTITDSITVEAWVCPTAFGSTPANGTILCKHSWSNGEGGYVLRAGGAGILSFNIGGDSLGINVSWKEVVSPSGSLVLNAWQHVAGTYDGYNIKIYVNGILKGTRAFSGGVQRGKIINSVYPPKISLLSDPGQSPQRYWSGFIDEVRIYHRALSQAEIADSMSAHITPSAQIGLVGYWRMNNGSGNTFSDLSTSNNSGSLSGATWTTQVPFNDAPAAAIITPGAGFLHSSIATHIQWYKNGVILLPGDTLQDYYPLVPASYTVVVTDSTGCTASSIPFSFVNVEENTADRFLMLSPNPAHDILTIQLKNTTVINRIEITDLEGRMLFSKNGIHSDHLDIPVDQYARGIYFAKIYSTDSELMKKFIVN